MANTEALSMNGRPLATGDHVYADVANAERKCRVIETDGPNVSLYIIEGMDDYGLVSVPAAKCYKIGE